MRNQKSGKINITVKILLGLILGVVFGAVLNMFAPQEFVATLVKWVLNPAGQIFMRGIRMLVVPLVLVSLICGAASIGDPKKLGRVGIKTIAFYLVTTALAITLALTLANIISPGMGLNLATDKEFTPAPAPFIMDIFVNMVPTNPIDSMAKGEMLPIIVFAVLFGIGLAHLGDKAKPLTNVLDIANHVLMKVISIVMLIAPYAVFALISRVVATEGFDMLAKLAKYMITILLALAIHCMVVYGGTLYAFTKLSPIKFFKKFARVMVVAFSTSSSNATLPVTIETAEKDLGVSNKIASFCLPLGATINMDGTAIMQGVAAVFIAQIYGIELTLSSQLMIILTATLASIGTAGAPGVGMITLAMVLQSVNLPVEGIMIVMSVDRILDMSRTAINITGDAVASIIVAKSEGELDVAVYNSELSSSEAA